MTTVAISSIYLSRLALNPGNSQVRAELARPYEMHRTLSRAFPPDTFCRERDNGESAGVLFRVDEKPRENIIVVLVQSKIAPDWSFLNDVKDVRGHAYLLHPPESKPLGLKLAAGQTLAFRLRANPTRRLGKAAGNDKSKRVGIYKEEEQRKWLREKLEGNEHRQSTGGFHLLDAQISREEKFENPNAINRAEQSHDLKLFAVQFDGVLKVIDKDRAIGTIERGIGSAKGFGFGLLSIAPIRE